MFQKTEEEVPAKVPTRKTKPVQDKYQETDHKKSAMQLWGPGRSRIHMAAVSAGGEAVIRSHNVIFGESSALGPFQPHPDYLIECYSLEIT